MSAPCVHSRPRRVIAVLACAAVLGGALASPASAARDVIDCTDVGVYDPQFDNWFIDHQVLDGDVVVPNLSPDEGALCIFANPIITGNLIIEASSPQQGDLGPVALIFAGAEGGTIEGNVRVQRGADFANYGATVGGNVVCNGCDRVELAGGIDFDGDPFTTTVHGNVTVHDATFGASVREAVVGGNVSIKRSTAAFDPDNWVFDPVEVTASTIDGNVHVAGNTGNPDSIQVADNTIGGNLTCRRNDPSPVLGAGNTVLGNALGQCR
ncbi:MAG: hypothetical protein WCA82_02050 [Jiangellales bacterium]